MPSSLSFFEEEIAGILGSIFRLMYFICGALTRLPLAPRETSRSSLTDWLGSSPTDQSGLPLLDHVAPVARVEHQLAFSFATPQHPQQTPKCKNPLRNTK